MLHGESVRLGLVIEEYRDIILIYALSRVIAPAACGLSANLAKGLIQRRHLFRR